MRTNEDLENAEDVLNELLEHHQNLQERERSNTKTRVIGCKHTCPRCRSITILQTEDPYCNYCNWDSLEDQTNYQFS